MRNVLEETSEGLGGDWKSLWVNSNGLEQDHDGFIGKSWEYYKRVMRE